MRITGQIYNHLTASVTPKKRVTTHKSSELRDIYTKMAKYNQSSPLYLLSLSDDKQEDIINIKESAITLRDTVNSFSNPEDIIYSNKIFNSSDEAAITGALKKADTSSLPETIDIEINSLATTQINTGEFLPSNELSLITKEHRFSLNTVNSSSRFGITVGKGDTNLDIQNKLASYINNRNVGVIATVVSDGRNSALKLESMDTGKPSTDDGLHFSFNVDNAGQSLVNIFGLNNVTTSPENSTFSINGDKHISSSNHISINQVVELDFHKTTDTPVHIGLVPDTKQAMEQLSAFTSAYNNLISLSSSTDKDMVGTRNISQDMSGILSKHRGNLESIGIITNPDGTLSINEEALTTSFKNGDFTSIFSDETSIQQDIMNSTNRFVLDPIAYINKTIVTYPNVNNKLGNAYTQSLYSGLMYNNYA